MRSLTLLTTALLIAGCGTHNTGPSASAQLNGLLKATKRQDEPFRAVTIAELAAWDRPANEGRRVALQGKLEPLTYALGYGYTYHGYQLLDADHRPVLCQNLYSVVTPASGGAKDSAKDLTAEARQQLLKASVVRVEGTYHPSHQETSHGGVYTVPASVEVVRIDGQGLEALRREGR